MAGRRQGDAGACELQGRAFFLNAEMLVNEGEAYEMLQRIIGAEIIYSRKFGGKNASLQDLIRLGGVPGTSKTARRAAIASC